MAEKKDLYTLFKELELEVAREAFQLDRYTSLYVMARNSEPSQEEDGTLTIKYDFLDYAPEPDSQEYQTCEWAVVGFVDTGEQNDDEEHIFEVIGLFWEQEAADAFLRICARISGLPIGSANAEENL